MEAPLVIFHKQLGDLLLAEAGLARLAAASGGAVRLSTRRSFLPMVSLMENVKGESGVRLSRASEVISLSPNFHAAAKAAATLAPSKKLWVLSPKHLKWWHPLSYPQGAQYVPAWEQYRGRYYFDIMPQAPNIDFRPPRLRHPPTDWRHPKTPQDYVLLHPTSAWPSKCWSPQKWSKVIAALHSAGYGPFVITGGIAEWEQSYTKRICDDVSTPIINLSGGTTLHQYLRTVADARLLLCVDGSASHLAAAFGRPSITLFGNTPHSVWHLPSRLSSCLTPPPSDGPDAVLIDRISTESVIELALQKLAAQHTADGQH
jgi:ADP-heptose:LPS heptosyltransferase